MKPFENGWNPFKSETVFLAGHFFYAFSNEHGEAWVAYISLWSYDVLISGEDVDWSWRSLKPGLPLQDQWAFNLDEQTWVCSVFQMARNLREQGASQNESKSQS